MSTNFYDKVAKKFGQYHTKAKYTVEYLNGNAEKDFKAKLLELEGVPIFEDYDSKKDKKFLDEYVRKFRTEKGIKFPRHQVVILAKKPI